jgi:Restriction Enzyme Adenine Methylase Associated
VDDALEQFVLATGRDRADRRLSNARAVARESADTFTIVSADRQTSDADLRRQAPQSISYSRSQSHRSRLLQRHDCRMSTSPMAAVNVQVPSSATAPIIADFAEHAIRVAYVARRDAKRLPETEWTVPGVYVLVSDDGSHSVYVGKSTGLRGRLLQHTKKNAQVPNWSRAVLVKRDTTNGFTSADIGYLEGRLSAELGAITGIQVAKGKADGDATLPLHMQMSLDALLTSILAAVRLAGIDIYREDEDEADPPVVPTRVTYRGSIADLIAEGLLHAGTELHCSRAGQRGVGTVASDGQILVGGVGYKAPSRAAGASLGAETSTGYGGWEMWRVGTPDGPTLASLRVQLPGFARR